MLLLQQGYMQCVVDRLVAVEKKREDILWKKSYAERIADIAAHHDEGLKAELACAEALADRAQRGWELMEGFAKWINMLYDGIDVRAENQIVVCREELPQDARKYRQLLAAVRSDARRRHQQTQEALLATHKDLTQIEKEISRLERCHRGNDEEYVRRMEDHGRLRQDVRTLQEDLQGLEEEEMSLNSISTVMVLDVEQGALSNEHAEHTISETWVADVFFTRSQSHTAHISIFEVPDSERRHAPLMLSLAPSVSSCTLHASTPDVSSQLSGEDVTDFALVGNGIGECSLMSTASTALPSNQCTILDSKPTSLDGSVSPFSADMREAVPRRRIARTIRPAHDERCTAVCMYHFAGKCHRGVLCPRCHHPSHYKDKRARAQEFVQQAAPRAPAGCGSSSP